MLLVMGKVILEAVQAIAVTEQEASRARAHIANLFFLKVKYSWYTRLCWFRVYSIVTWQFSQNPFHHSGLPYHAIYCHSQLMHSDFTADECLEASISFLFFFWCSILSYPTHAFKFHCWWMFRSFHFLLLFAPSPMDPGMFSKLWKSKCSSLPECQSTSSYPLSDLANKNTCNRWYILTLKQKLLFIWNSSVTGHPVFSLAILLLMDK